MKIDSTYSLNTPRALNTGSPRQQPASIATTENTAVSLSRSTQTLKTADAMPVNSSRVQEIKDAIASGQFKINADAIAGSLLDMARDLVAAQTETHA